MDIGRLYGDTYGFLGHPGLEALRTAQDRGADAIELNVLPANEGAQAFWQRRGFRLNTLGFRRDLDAHHA